MSSTKGFQREGLNMKLKLLALFGSLALFTSAIAQSGLPDFTQIVEKATPAIVTIYITAPMTKEEQEAADAPPFLFDLPPGLGPFTVPPQVNPHAIPPPIPKVTPKDKPKDEKPKDKHWMGSGFIITSNGYIITNRHVVDGASTINVELSNHREYKAKVIGADELSDVAVIKIDATSLSTVTIGHSSQVKPGQWVLAIGSPFNFVGSVSAGIVSAINRDTPDGSSTYTPFIQIDAAINHGNSGGPLFNLAGEVIGINSQIYSGTGDFAGIAFAIPIDTAMNVESQLVADGHVTRSRIGIVISRVDQEHADKAGLDRPRGAWIVSIAKDSPGIAAGLKADDIVLAIDNLPIEISSQLPIIISNIKPGSIASLQVWRDKQIITLHINVVEMKGIPKIDPKDLPPE